MNIDIEHYRELLLARKAEAEQQLHATTEDSQPVSLDLPIGRLTRQDALQDQQVARHMKDRLRLQVTAIDAALARQVLARLIHIEQMRALAIVADHALYPEERADPRATSDGPHLVQTLCRVEHHMPGG